jgi:hypothetical protein
MMKRYAWSVCWSLLGAASALAGGVEIKQRATVEGSVCDQLTWPDAVGAARTIAVVTQKDKEGHWGGYLPHVSYRAEMTMASSKGPIRATVDYFVRSGRDDFVYAVTFDASKVEGLGADTRSPYIEFDWEGNGRYGDALSGFGWASANKQFRTTGETLNAQSPWDWTAECVIPHVIEWKSPQAGDAEIGLIQTQTYAQHNGGSGWWQKQGQSGTGLPENWNCTYQLNAYQGYATKKTTWMMPYGAVGMPAYDVFDYSRKASGFPHQSYSLLCVLDRHSYRGVDSAVAEMVCVQTAAKLTATTGTVTTKGIAGAGRTDTVDLAPAGWDHVYAAWTISSSSNAAKCVLDVNKGELRNPTFCLTGYGGSESVSCTLNGSKLTADKDFFASLDGPTKRLFVTFGRTLGQGKSALSFQSTGRR